ncbi:MAG TPA: NAD-dependent epimerase/dehydratase family protein [Nitrospirae bacterium]|nr:NAD-dependent epimerase/dehydratase family protein [Nitrospirota bacterium]
MVSILVTGSAGFIGAKTTQLLLQSGYKVIGIDNINNYYDVTVKEHRLKCLEGLSSFVFYKDDIEDINALDYIFKQHEISAVINLAARAGVRYSLINPHVYMTTNVLGTLNLLEMMRKYNVSKMILASTSSLYAGHPMPFVESAPVNNPLSPYAASKKSAEAISYSYHYLYGMDITVLRYFTVYGPMGRPDMSVFRFIKWIDEGIPIELFGDGSQSRDFTYIDDIAKGTILSLKLKGFQIINLGGGKQPVSINYIIEKISSLLNKEAKIDYKVFHKADMIETSADISLAKVLLNWQPITDIEEGLINTVNWHIANRDWLKDVKL